MCYGCLLAKRCGVLNFAHSIILPRPVVQSPVQADSRAADVSKVANVCRVANMSKYIVDANRVANVNRVVTGVERCLESHHRRGEATKNFFLASSIMARCGGS